MVNGLVQQTKTVEYTVELKIPRRPSPLPPAALRDSVTRKVQLRPGGGRFDLKGTVQQDLPRP